MDYCLIIKSGISTTVYGPADYDEAIKFGMVLLSAGESVTMIPMTPIN